MWFTRCTLALLLLCSTAHASVDILTSTDDTEQSSLHSANELKRQVSSEFSTLSTVPLTQGVSTSNFPPITTSTNTTQSSTRISSSAVVGEPPSFGSSHTTYTASSSGGIIGSFIPQTGGASSAPGATQTGTPGNSSGSASFDTGVTWKSAIGGSIGGAALCSLLIWWKWASLRRCCSSRPKSKKNWKAEALDAKTSYAPVSTVDDAPRSAPAMSQPHYMQGYRQAYRPMRKVQEY